MLLQFYIIIFILVSKASLLPITYNKTTYHKHGNHFYLEKFHTSLIKKSPKNGSILFDGNSSTVISQPNKSNHSIAALIFKLRTESVGKPSHAVGRLVAAWKPGRSNPEEFTLYKHGDILHKVLPDNRGGVIDANYRWPNGTIYYNISGNFNYDQHRLILRAMRRYHKRTCIKFVQITGSESDFVSIESGPTGCWSSLGRLGGKQVVNLQPPNCVYQIGSVIHELMHTVGFFHEQSRIDRDDYVKIVWQNVIPGRENNFDKYPSTLYGESYDYNSVMHYSAVSMSKNNQKTMIPLMKGVTIGQRRGFSRSDVRKIRAMYSCPPMQELPGDEIDDEEDDDEDFEIELPI